MFFVVKRNAFFYINWDASLILAIEEFRAGDYSIYFTYSRWWSVQGNNILNCYSIKYIFFKQSKNTLIKLYLKSFLEPNFFQLIQKSFNKNSQIENQTFISLILIFIDIINSYNLSFFYDHRKQSAKRFTINYFTNYFRINEI